MVAFNKIGEGDILWDCRMVRMGNTTMKRMANYKVRVISVDREAETALASWNSNPPRIYFRRQIEKLRRSPREIT